MESHEFVKSSRDEIPRPPLIIFDIDGTLADRDTHQLLPGVYDWFTQNASNYLIALATNQGGVGLRYWMETDGFGDPSAFPTEGDVEAHITAVIDQLPEMHRRRIKLRTYRCYAYQSKKSGKWSPTPPGYGKKNEWAADFRKPSSGMLIQAMVDYRSLTEKTLMVGDSEEDRGAAEEAKVDFCLADEFFGRNA